MDGLPCQEGYYCAAPICLLYMDKAGQLLPIAIQLKKEPGEDNPIFLPTDHWIDWLLAKIYYRSADAQVCKRHDKYNFVYRYANYSLGSIIIQLQRTT